MPSLADIPSHLMDKRMKLDFLNWLTQLAIDEPVARQFMRLWGSANQRAFDSEDWDFVTRSIERRRGH